MIIGTDLDDVIYPWFRAAHDICDGVGITNGVTPTKWTPYDEYGCSKELWIDTLVDSGDSLYFFDPMPGALDALDEIVVRGHDLVIITARGSFGSNGEEIKGWTLDWLKMWQIPATEVIFSPDKTVVKTDWFIDDRADHVDDLLRVGTKARLHDQPWNADARHLDNVRRMNITEYVDEILA